MVRRPVGTVENDMSHVQLCHGMENGVDCEGWARTTTCDVPRAEAAEHCVDEVRHGVVHGGAAFGHGDCSARRVDVRTCNVRWKEGERQVRPMWAWRPCVMKVMDGDFGELGSYFRVGRG